MRSVVTRLIKFETVEMMLLQQRTAASTAYSSVTKVCRYVYAAGLNSTACPAQQQQLKQEPSLTQTQSKPCRKCFMQARALQCLPSAVTAAQGQRVSSVWRDAAPARQLHISSIPRAAATEADLGDDLRDEDLVYPVRYFT
jgi:hypothetical protein